MAELLAWLQLSQVFQQLAVAMVEKHPELMKAAMVVLVAVLPIQVRLVLEQQMKVTTEV
jgi:hypothetical protein